MPHRETDVSERLDNLESSAYDRRYIDADGVALLDILPTDLQLESVTAGSAGAFVILSWMGWQPEVETFEIWLEAPDQPAEKIGEFATSPATLTITVKVDTPVVLTVRARAGDRTVGFAQSPSVAALIPAPISSALGPNSVGDSHLIHMGTDRIIIKNADILNLNANKLNAGSIDAGVITVRNIDAGNINTGNLNAAVVNVINLNANNIRSGTLDASIVNIINFAVPEILSGVGAPDDANGKNGDTYIQDDGAVWRKVAGAWSDTGINLSGADSTATDGKDGATIQTGDVAVGSSPAGNGITVGDIFFATDGRWWRWSGTAWVFRGDLTGRDGPGSEWVFRVTLTNVAPALVQLTAAKRLLDDQFPADWSDDPHGVDETNQFEWVAHRARNSAGSWSEFSDPGLWAVYRKDGTNADNINRGTLNAGIVNVTNIKAGNIKTGTLDAAVVRIIHLDASNISTGSLSANRISGGTIDAASIRVINLDADNIQAGTLTGISIAGGSFSLISGIQSMQIDGVHGFFHRSSRNNQFVSLLHGSVLCGIGSVVDASSRIRLLPGIPAAIEVLHTYGRGMKAVELSVETSPNPQGIIRTYRRGLTSTDVSVLTASLVGGLLKLYKTDGTVGITLDPEDGVVLPEHVIAAINTQRHVPLGGNATDVLTRAATDDAYEWASTRTDAEILALTEEWGHIGNLTEIPANKLTLAPGGNSIYFRGSGETLRAFPPAATFGKNQDVAVHADGRVLRKRAGAWAGISLVIPRPTSVTAIYEEISSLVHSLDVKWSGGNYIAEVDIGYVPTLDLRNLTGAIWGAHTAVSAASYYRFRRIYQPVPNGRAVRVRFIGAFGQRGPWAYALYTTSSALYITSFVSNKPVIRVGESVTLSWEVRNAVSASIDQEVGNIASAHRLRGSVTVSPIARTTYTLTVVKGEDTLTSSVTINVLAPLRQPSITSFAADDATILTTETTTIRWAAVNGVSGTIRGTSLNRALTSAELTAGTLDVGPLIAGAHTYTLTIVGEAGSTTAAATFTITVAEAPVIPVAVLAITSFSADRTRVQAGDTVTLTWVIANADSASINQGVGAIGSADVASGSITVTPSVNTVYILSAVKGADTVTKQVAITISVSVEPTLDQPSIALFTATDNTLTLTQSTTIKWRLSNVVSGRITGPSLDRALTNSELTSGSQSIGPLSEGTHSYSIVVQGEPGTDDATRTFSVSSSAITTIQQVVIDSFTASPTAIISGGSITLRWRTSHATSVTLDGVQVNPDDSKRVTPTVDTTYDLVANGEGGPVPKSVSISILVPARITRFAAGDATLTPTQTTTVSWAAQNGVSGAITGPGLDRALTNAELTSGTLTAGPLSVGSYTYRLRILGESGTRAVTSSFVITVAVPPVITPPMDDPVTIDSFSADPSSIVSGESTRLSWETSHATEVTFDGTTVQADDGVDRSPTVTTTYVLKATGHNGPVTKSVKVTVSPPPTPRPSITYFRVSSTRISVGSSVTLSWATANSTDRQLTGRIGGSSTTIIDRASASGTRTVTPLVTTTYVITAWVGGNTPMHAVSKTVTVTVTGAPMPVIDSFSISDRFPGGGENFTISWTTTNATRVILQGRSDTPSLGIFQNVGGNRSADGSYTTSVSGGSIRSYRIIAYNVNNQTRTSSIISVEADEEEEEDDSN